MTERLPPAAVIPIGVAVAVALVLLIPLLVAGPLGAIASEPMAETLFALALFGGLIAAGWLGARLSGLNAFTPGDRPATMLALGGFTGLFGVVLAAALAALLGGLRVGEAVDPTLGLLIWGLVVVLFQAGAEEVYFRGWLQPVAVRAWGASAGVVVASLAFALLHVFGGARAPVSLVNLFLGGLLFGTIALLGRGIAGAVAAHGAWNGAEQLALGLDPNPGTGSFGAAMNFDLFGAVAGGAEEGLNASAAMTAVLVALLIPAIVLLRRRTPA